MEDDVVFSSHVFTKSFQEEFKQQWESGCDFKGTDLEIISKPFRVCRISNFLRGETFIENLKYELEEEGHSRSFSDLYKNEKSEELRNASGDHIQLLYISLERYVSRWMRQNTGIHLDGDISMRSVRYYDTDHLLCHNDHTEIRRIAFIIYLTKDWTESDGGTLDLFDADEYGAPTYITKSIVPEYNSFVFFEVVGNSYHQIAEIKSSNKCRWALSGWFLGSKDDYCRLRRFNTIANYIKPSIANVILSDWISRVYLTDRVKSDIQTDMEKNSYIAICGFLTNSVYKEISKSLTSKDIKWEMVGPADIRHYEVADKKTLPELLKEFYKMFKSFSFRQLLKDYTDLDLVFKKKKKKTKPKMTIEIQRWSAGCYTLLYNRAMMEDLTNTSKDSVQSDDDLSDIAPTLNAWSTLNTSLTASTSTLDILNASFTSNTSNTSVQSDTVPNIYANKTYNELKRKSIDSLSLSPTSSNKKKKTRQVASNTSNTSVQSDTVLNIYTNKTYNELKKKSIDSLSLSPTSSNKKKKARQVAPLPDVNAQSSSINESSINTNESEDDSSLDVTLTSEMLTNEISEDNNSEKSEDNFLLDLIMQFNTLDAENKRKTEETIDYIDPEHDNTLIQIPSEENQLALVFRSLSVGRLQQYLNHYYKGYSYAIVCEYQE